MLDEPLAIAGDIRSISDMMRLLDTFPRSPARNLYYRGESKIHPTMSPKIMRGNGTLVDYEGVMLADMLRERPEEFVDATTSFMQWMKAQHYGLPTRFLDVSENPLVGLFFSCWENLEDDGRLIVFSMPNGPDGFVVNHDSYNASLISNYAKLANKSQSHLSQYMTHYLVQDPKGVGDIIPELLHLHNLILKDHPTDDPTVRTDDGGIEMNVKYLSRIFAITPPRAMDRVRSQHGAFITSGTCNDMGNKIFYANSVIDSTDGIQLIEPPICYRVPRKWKKRILEQLAAVCVTEPILFPGLQTSAKATVERYSRRSLSGSDE